MDLQKVLNLNISAYLVNTLEYPHNSTWNYRGGPTARNIYHFSLNPDYWRSVENIWKIVISCIEQGIKYTGRNGTVKDIRPQLVNYSSEINMLAN